MASVGPRGRRLHKSQIPSTVHVVGHQGETHGETNPFCCSRLGDKSNLPILATFKAGLGNASDHISTRKTPDLNKNVSERQSPQPQPVANVRGGADMLFYRYEIHAAPPLKFHKLRPPSQAFKQHTLIEELSSNVNVHNALKLAQRPL